jgi:para-nitrobenzyl esterase
VREHIGEFGGDPDQVTFAGQSAGALSALALMSGVDTAALFQRVILQSTPAGVAPATPSAAAEVAERFVHALGAPPRQVPVAQILAAQSEVVRQLAPAMGIEPPFQFVASPGLVAENPVRAMGHMPRLISVTQDEGAAFQSPGDVLTEQVFHRHIPELATGGDSYVCQFDWHPDGNPLRACHCIELPFVFDTLPAWRDAPMLAGPSPRPELVAEVQTAWIAFIRTGNPDWPLYRENRHILRFG